MLYEGDRGMFEYMEGLRGAGIPEAYGPVFGPGRDHIAPRGPCAACDAADVASEHLKWACIEVHYCHPPIIPTSRNERSAVWGECERHLVATVVVGGNPLLDYPSIGSIPEDDGVVPRTTRYPFAVRRND